MNPLLERIWIDPRICGGKPCIKGTRIWVSLILDFLADSMTEPEVLAEYPGLTHTRACRRRSHTELKQPGSGSSPS